LEKENVSKSNHTFIIALKILDKYIIKNYLLTFVFVLILITLISIVVDYTEKLDAIVSKHASLKDVLKYFAAFVPYINAFIFPLIVFISVIFFVSRLAYRTEVVAMLTSSMSYNRYLAPFIFCSALLAGVILYANHYLVPRANKQRIAFENKYINVYATKTSTDYHVRISKNEYVYMKSFNQYAKMGNNFCYEKIVGQRLLEKITAEQIQYDSVKKTWRLQDVQIRKNDGDKEQLTRLDAMVQAYSFKPEDFVEVTEQKSTMTRPMLLAYINKETLRGNPNLVSYRFEHHRRSAAPFSVLILNIIGVCIASKKVRGGSGIHLAIGLIFCGAFVIFMQFSTAFATKGGLSPLLAAWIPNIVFGIIAYVIYKKWRQ
jgi:lipopolysaccharide export system permease protein